MSWAGGVHRNGLRQSQVMSDGDNIYSSRVHRRNLKDPKTRGTDVEEIFWREVRCLSTQGQNYQLSCQLRDFL